MVARLIDITKFSKLEKKVYNALLKTGVQFEAQVRMMGGRDVRGGAVVDFLIRGLRLILRVQGRYYHAMPEAKARDMIQKIALSSQGWTVIDLMESHINKNARFYVTAALRGQSYAFQL